MAILGNIIKGVIGITDTLSAEPNHKENQEKVLKKLLETAQQTQFGEHYNFNSILKSDNLSKSFAEKVPYFDYHQMNEKWWHKLHKGETDITWPNTPSYFALSSGTTGKTSKRIPITNEMIEALELNKFYL